MYRRIEAKTLHRLIFGAIIMFALLLLCTGTSYAETVEEGTCGDNITWTLDEEGTLTISGEGAMGSYEDSDDYPWYESLKSAKKIIIEEGITEIGDYAFGNTVRSGNGTSVYGYSTVTEIELPDSLTKIGNYSFSYHSRLQQVVLPDHLKAIGNSSFYNCKQLSEINLPGSLTVIGSYAFSRTSIENIIIPDGIAEISDGLFMECLKLTSITLPDSITSIGAGAFVRCGFSEIELPVGLTEIGHHAFRYCNNLTELTIPKKASLSYNVVESCSKLSVIRLLCPAQPGNEPTSALIGYSGTIYYPGNDPAWDEDTRNAWCSTATWIADDMTVERDVIASGDLSNDVSWTLDDTGKLTINGTGAINQYDKVDDYPWYEYKDIVTFIVIDDGVTEVGDFSFGDSGYNSNGVYQKLSKVVIPGSVKHIGDYAFACNHITKLTLSEGLESIGEYAFNWCNFLKSVDLPDSVVSIGAGAFKSCTVLGDIVIPSGVTEINDDTFASCKNNLKHVSIPATVTSIGKGAFASCYKLEEIDLPAGLKSIGDHAFYECRTLKEVHVPDGIEVIGSSTFKNCYNLSKIDLPENIKEIGPYAFSYTSLTTIRLPESLEIMENAVFDNCNALETITIDTYAHWCSIHGKYIVNWSPLQGSSAKLVTEDDSGSVVIPEGITKIPYGTFRGNDKLTSIELPKSLKTIEGNAFDSCENLTVVEVPNINSWCKISFANDMSNPLNASPDAMLQVGGGTGSKATIAEGVTSIPDRTFYNWDALGTVTLPSSIKRICAGAFTACTGIKTVNVNDLDSWLAIDFATSDSSPLNSGKAQIKVNGGIGYNAVTDVNINKTVSSIPAYAFSGSTSLKNVVIPEGVSRIGAGAFACCTGLTGVTIPETVTALEEKTFSGCSDLKKIYIPETITRIEPDAFSGCAKDLVIYGSEGSVAQTYSNEFGITFLPYSEYDAFRAGNITDNIRWTLIGGTTLTIEAADDTSEEDCVIPDYTSGNSPLEGIKGQVTTVKLKGVTGIGDYLFEDFSSLKRVDVGLDTSLEQIGSKAFSGCGNVEIRCYSNCYDKVTNIISSGSDFTGITVKKLSGSKLGNATWTYNENTKTLLLSSNGSSSFGESFDESPFEDLNANIVEFSDSFSCTDIPDNLFKGCDTITEVYLPEKVTAIGSDAFNGCTNLKTVHWYSGINSIGSSAFKNCTSLDRIQITDGGLLNENSQEISEDAIEIPEGVKQIPAGAFRGCSSLTRVDWYDDPKSSTSDGTIESEAFSGCAALTDINIPDHVGTIGSKAFSGCTTLGDQVFGSGLRTIGEQAYYDCTALSVMEFEEDLQDIGSKAFGFYKDSNDNDVASAGFKVQAPESATTLKNYCTDNDFCFVTTDGIGGSEAGEQIYVELSKSSVTVKKNKSVSVKFKTNGKVKKVTASVTSGKGNVSVTRSGNKVRFKGLKAGTASVSLQFNMKGSNTVKKKTVTVKIKKASASLDEGDAQALSANKKSLTFAGDTEAAQKVTVTGAITKLACKQSESGIVKISITGNKTVTVTPIKSGTVTLTFSAPGDDYTAASNTVNVKVTVKARPKTVTAKVKKLSKKKAQVSWDKISGASSYQIQVAQKKSFVGKKSYSVKAGTLKKTVAIKPGKTNYIRVRYKFKGKYSKWSKTLVVKK